MTKDQKYKREYAGVLVRIAESDSSPLEILHRSVGGRKENVCFIAQQVVEKCLKGLLVHCGIAVPFTHSIELLLSKLPSDFLPPKGASLDALTEYATIRRYEEGYAELSPEDLQAAVDAAKHVLEFAKTKIFPTSA